VSVIARFDVYTFDSDERLVTTADGTAVHLTPKAFDLLGLLIAEAPRVVTKSDLHKRLWPDTFVSDATLVGLVKELRRALPSQNGDAPIIRTSHGVGYAFGGRLLAALPSQRFVTRWIAIGGRRIPLQPGENLIGRDPGSAVWLDVAGVSRRHARIIVGDRDARIEDLGSKNGTQVRGARLEAPALLRDGDRITVGSILLVYRASDLGMSTETIVTSIT
jgi:DNA-binding winged helix-turn-helix (wHTH) protein